MTAFVQRPGDDHQIGHKDAPADPTLETVGAVGWATLQLNCALHHTDATFNSIAKALGLPEPGLLFIAAALGCAQASVWNSDLLDTQTACQAFIVRGEEAAVARQHARRMTETLAMLSQQGRQHLGVRRIALGDDLPIADQAVFNFSVVDLVPELGFMRLRFATSDDLRVRLP